MNRRPIKSGRRKHTSRQGAAAVEFAITISLLLVIMFASIEFSRLNMLEHSIEHASYLAARRGMITGATKHDVESTAKLHLDLLGVSGETITVSPSKIDDDTRLIDVSIDVPLAGNTWISPVYFGGTLTARTRMLTERVAADMAGAAGVNP